MQNPLPMHQSPRCGAKTRRGSPCRSPAMRNGRCRMHGGKSPGAPIGNRNALKHGRYTTGAVKRRRELAALLREMRQLVEEVDRRITIGTITDEPAPLVQPHLSSRRGCRTCRLSALRAAGSSGALAPFLSDSMGSTVLSWISPAVRRRPAAVAVKSSFRSGTAGPGRARTWRF